MNSISLEDCRNTGELEFVDWNALKDSVIMITGATGLIGSNLVDIIAYNSESKGLDIKLVLPVRNAEKARERFKWQNVEIIPYTLGSSLTYGSGADYIVHLASPTDSKFFTVKPADTLLSNIEGTKALLQWAVDHPVKKFIYVSSMEVYGFHGKGEHISEHDLGAFETMNARNSYPVAKIACECLCNSFYCQYGVPAVVLRATQTFGPGVQYDDNRVFAQFMRCALENKDIVLKTAGLTERPYLYTADAVSAILVSMLKAEAGQAYTVSNPETYCSIREMADMVAEKVAGGKIAVKTELVEDVSKLGYAETLYMDLDVSKLRALGWQPQTALYEMFMRMIASVINTDKL